MNDDDPVLRVIRGDPTAEEVAALVSVVLGRTRVPATGAMPGAGNWVRSARPGPVTGGLPGRRGGNAWRFSALPR